MTAPKALHGSRSLPEHQVDARLNLQRGER